jgi:hypothetical protein
LLFERALNLRESQGSTKLTDNNQGTKPKKPMPINIHILMGVPLASEYSRKPAVMRNPRKQMCNRKHRLTIHPRLKLGATESATRQSQNLRVYDSAN